jgi:hypothetical protein
MIPLMASLAYWTCLLAATSPDTPEGILDFLTRGGLLGGAILLIWMLLTDRLVSGSRHRRELAQRDEAIARLWQALDRSTGSLERVSGTFFPPAETRER